MLRAFSAHIDQSSIVEIWAQERFAMALAGDSLTYSTQAWCAGTDLADLQKLFGVEQYAQTPTMDKTLAALQKCRG